MLEPNSKAPSFKLKNQDDQWVSLDDFEGKNVVIFFYPKDSTSGCTREAQDFTALQSEFMDYNTVILGVSKDSVSSHKKFCEKSELSVTLLSDPETSMIDTYGVWQEKSMYGRKYMGISRTTYLLDAKQQVKQVWEKVKVPNHAQTVLEAVKQVS